MGAQGLIYCTNGGEWVGMGAQRRAEWKQDSSTVCLCVEGTEQDSPTACTSYGGDWIRVTHCLSMSQKGWDGTHPLLACVVPPLEVQDQLLPHRLVSREHRQGRWRQPALNRISG